MRTVDASYNCNDSRREFGIFARSVRVKLRLNCYTVAAQQTQVRPVLPPSLVPYTNRPFGYQRRRMNRLAIASAPHATCHIMYILLCACSCNKPPLSTAITHCPVQPLRIGAELAQLEGTDSGTRRCLVPVGWGVGTPRPKKRFNVFAENDAIFSLGRRSVWVH